MLFNLLTQREEFRLHLSYRESYLFTNQSFCSSKHCFIFILTFSQYSDTLLSGDGHWENIFCERKATQWPSRSWTWNFNPAVRADQEYQLWYSEALVNRKDGDNGLERIGMCCGVWSVHLSDGEREPVKAFGPVNITKLLFQIIFDEN